MLWPKFCARKARLSLRHLIMRKVGPIIIQNIINKNGIGVVCKYVFLCACVFGNSARQGKWKVMSMVKLRVAGGVIETSIFSFQIYETNLIIFSIMMYKCASLNTKPYDTKFSKQNKVNNEGIIE